MDLSMKEKYFTLVFIKTEARVLLGLKKRGFAKGLWNGYGGKLERDEDAYECAIREVHEESRLELRSTDLKYLGKVVYFGGCLKYPTRVVHIFTTNVFCSEAWESEEMIPKWFDFANLPYDQMLPDAQYWLPLVLQERWMYASFIYNGEELVLNEKSIQLLESPPAAVNAIS